jgi:hypothetical protein
MTSLSISTTNGATAAVTPPPSGNSIPAGSENFADLLDQLGASQPPLTHAEVKARDQAHLLKRVAEVGFSRAMGEEQEKEKMMRILTLMEADSSPDMRAVLSSIGDDFQRNPPNGLNDMYGRIQKLINKMPPDTSNNLKQRLSTVFVKIKQLMVQPDGTLKRLEQNGGLA